MKDSDYNMILKHYGFRIPQSKRIKKKMVEDLLSNKMCRCIKSVQQSSKLQEPASIAICNQSIFRNRGLKYNKLKCKPKPQFIGNKKTKKKLVKTQKKLTFKKKHKTQRKTQRKTKRKTH